MFRCVSSNLRLTPSYKRQTTHLLFPSKFTTSKLIKPSFRHSFSTSQFCREKLKEQVATTTTPVRAKKTDSSDVKQLFQLAKPEAKSLTGIVCLNRRNWREKKQE
jgi:hypothetical protein